METAKHVITLSAALLLALIAFHPAAAMDQAETSDSSSASCLVKVTAHPAILPLNLATVDSLLRSSAVAGKAVRDVLGISFSELPYDAFEIQQLDSGVSANVDSLGVTGIPPASSLQMTSPVHQSSASEAPSPGQTPAQSNKQVPSSTRTQAATTRTPGFSTFGRATRTSPPRPATPSTPLAEAYGGYAGLSGHYGGALGGGYDPFGNAYRIGPARARPSAAPQTTASPALDQPTERTFLFQLSVNLPEADELLEALVENLRNVLNGGYEDYASQLRNQLDFAESRRNRAQSELSALLNGAPAFNLEVAKNRDPLDSAVLKQLDQVVDLSELTGDMPFSEAIDVLKNSVDPPLKIAVLWRDLYDNAETEPTTPTEMDGMAEVRLGAALELLLKAISGSFADLGYVVRDGVISIATVDSLPLRMETRVYEVLGPARAPGATNNLIDLIRETVEPQTWYAMNDAGDATIQLYMGNQIVVRQSPEVHEKIEKLLSQMEFSIPIGAGADDYGDLPPELLVAQKQELLRGLAVIEVELARFNARRSAIEQQVAETSRQTADRLENDPVADELEKVIEMTATQLANTESLVRAGRAGAAVLDKVKMELARARIELAKRRQDLGEAAGGNQLAALNSDLGSLAIDLAEKTAEAQVLKRQLENLNTQLSAVSTFHPELARIRLAKQSFDIADRQASDLRAIAAQLNPPTVAVVGAHIKDK